MTKAIQAYQASAFEDKINVEDICDAIANGTSLARFCAERRLHFGDVRRWLKDNVDRWRKYEDALEARDDWVSQNLCEAVQSVASFDPASIILENGQLKPIADWPASARAALKSLEYDPRTGMPKVQFLDRLKAAELLGRSKGTFAEKVQRTTSKTLAELILEAANGRESGKE